MIFKNLITWKDADQNLCEIAAFIFSEAAKQLRYRGEEPEKFTGTTSDGDALGTGWLSDDKTTPFLSCEEFILENHMQDPRFFGGNRADRTLDANDMSPLCWYSFQNIVRMRLKDARAELKTLCLSQKRGSLQSKQITRNPKGRPKKSKFSRKPER